MVLAGAVDAPRTDGLRVRAQAAWSWLQSNEAGLGVYEALGFVTLERWRCRVTAS